MHLVIHISVPRHPVTLINNFILNHQQFPQQLCTCCHYRYNLYDYDNESNINYIVSLHYQYYIYASFNFYQNILTYSFLSINIIIYLYFSLYPRQRAENPPSILYIQTSLAISLNIQAIHLITSLSNAFMIN